jgi:hypothetical protein
VSHDRLARWSPLAGPLFVVFFLVGVLLPGGIPGNGEPDSEIVAFYADGGNQLRLELGYLASTLAAVFFVWFVGVLFERVRKAEAGRRVLSGIVLVSGGAFTVFMLLGFAVGAMVAVAANGTTSFRIDPNTARILNDAAYSLTFETALPLVAPLVLAVSLIALRTETWPRWLGWAGVVVAFACIAGLLGVPVALFLAWVAVVAYYLLRPPAEDSDQRSPISS